MYVALMGVEDASSCYEALLGALHAGVVMHDGHQVIQACNPAAERILGLARDDMLGRTSVLPEGRVLREDGSPFPNHEHPAPASLRSGRPVRDVTMGVHRPDGTLAWIRADATPLLKPGDDQPYATVVSFTDISALKFAEAQLRDADRNKIVNRLAAGIAHEFNNILQAVMSALAMIREDAGADSEIGAVAALGHTAAKRGAKLIHALTSYSRQQILLPSKTSLNGEIPEIRTLLTSVLPPRVRLDMAVQRNLPPVHVDRTQLKTALLNLALNAAEAMPEGGRLRCEMRSASGISLGNQAIGAYVMIALSDSGSGFGAEALNRAFDPFFSTKPHGATGLGLSMVQGFCRQSGGDVRVTNLPDGGGARVEILLPACQRGTVLLVEDSCEVSFMTAAALRRLGFVVLTEDNGAKALDRLAANPGIDLLITDQMMPRMTGTELLGHARKLVPSLPVLVITGSPDMAAFPPGDANARLLYKPFDREQLENEVMALLGAASPGPAGEADGEPETAAAD